MRCVIQRIRDGKVYVNNEVVGKAGHGFLVLVGFTQDDTNEKIDWAAYRVAHMRIFPDDNGKLNKSLLDVGGEALVVSNFTLYGDPARGSRPDFMKAAKGEISKPMYDRFVAKLGEFVHVETGRFGEHMELETYSDGPITIILEK